MGGAYKVLPPLQCSILNIKKITIHIVTRARNCIKGVHLPLRKKSSPSQQDNLRRARHSSRNTFSDRFPQLVYIYVFHLTRTLLQQAIGHASTTKSLQKSRGSVCICYISIRNQCSNLRAMWWRRRRSRRLPRGILLPVCQPM